jgi:hypothetical protein
MNTTEINIVPYQVHFRDELLRLLLELQSVYYSKSGSALQQELEQAKDINRDYRNYIDYLESIEDDSWKIFMALNPTLHPIGFIIGSVSIDKDKVLETYGKVEDWFVEENYRRLAIGKSLYETLESWFRHKGCQHV